MKRRSPASRRAASFQVSGIGYQVSVFLQMRDGGAILDVLMPDA